MSTKTPKSMTLRTVPLRIMPGFRSFSSRTSVRRMGFGSSSRTSRPGLRSSAATSRRVGTPMPSSAAAFSSPMAAMAPGRSAIFAPPTSERECPVRASSRFAAS